MKKFILITVCALISFFGTTIWAVNSPLVEDYYYLYWERNNSDYSLSLAFAIALRRNHPTAYLMTIPELHPRLDEWMSTHHPQYCRSKPHLVLWGGNSNMIYACRNTDPEIYQYLFEVKDILIKDSIIIDYWPEIVEEIN